MGETPGKVAERSLKRGGSPDEKYNTKTKQVMAERKITMPIALKKNDNQYNPGYGMYYPEIVSTEALSLRGLCERVAFSQSVYSRDIVEGVVTKLRDALVELLQGGQPVKWDCLGTFTPTCESVKNGVSKADMQAGKANPNVDVEGIHIRFIPENSKGDQITSRALADLCVFDLAGIKKITKVTVNNKVKRYDELQSFEKWKKDNTPVPEP